MLNLLLQFGYKKEDVDCKLCTEYRGGKKCPHNICPYITERIEAGAVTYQEAINAIVHPGCQMIRRLPQLILSYPDSFWVDDRHKSRMEFFNTRMGYSPSRNTPAYYAAMYLLTANETLYIATWSQGKELKELRASLETINKTSSELISGIEQHYREICKEQGIDLAADAPAQEQTQVPDNAELPKPDAELESTSQQIDAPVPSSPDTPEPTSSMLPDASEQVLDEYPMPDESLKASDLEACGYLDGDMLPLSRERAVDLCDQDMTVYAIVDGGNAEMLFDREELDTQAPGTMFAVSREEWEQSPMFHEKIVERQQHQEERENAFLAHGGNCFAIYQVKRDDPGNVRFMNMDWMQSHGKAIARGSYDLIYTAPLTATGSTDAKLEAIFEQFNLHRPADYHSPSLSVSDIVAIKQSGVVSYHYCDSVGFKELPDFHLKAAEMSTEDDYGMIDGIINNGKQPTAADLEQQAKSGQPISLMDLADAAHREKKPSVLEKLKDQPQQPQRKSKPRKSKAQEI